MTDRIRRIDYFYVQIPDQPGEGVKLLGRLKEAGVNLLSMTAFPIEGGRAQVDLVPEKPDRLVEAAHKAGVTLSAKKQAILIQGKDRPGAAAEPLKKLADARVNVTAANAACGGEGRFGMILWVKPKDLETAVKALGA
ncbi:MAG TPA: ACT domain-containing protein [Candidatus Polarisedimenticolia bacterium]|nr:ACT domain-containing protein [Candidatus Polarisedimenticolia bacterium]